MTEEIRREIITLFYRTILKREPDEAGLEFYVGNDLFLETIYHSFKESDEAKNLKVEEEKLKLEKVGKLPITLAMFVKDVEDSIEMAINSVKSIVSEIVIVDTGSSDNSISICKGLGARVYSIDFDGFSGFGDLRTVTSHLARSKFVLGMDSDEQILEEDLPKFKSLIQRMEDEDIDIAGLPRKRWSSLSMEEQLELDVAPDLQFRFYKNKPEIYFTRRVHEIIKGSDKVIEVLDGPCIQHFQDSFKSGSKLTQRNKQYKGLYDTDIEEGVEHKGKAVEDLDER